MLFLLEKWSSFLRLFEFSKTNLNFESELEKEFRMKRTILKWLRIRQVVPIDVLCFFRQQRTRKLSFNHCWSNFFEKIGLWKPCTHEPWVFPAYKQGENNEDIIEIQHTNFCRIKLSNKKVKSWTIWSNFFCDLGLLVGWEPMFRRSVPVLMCNLLG